MGDPPADVDAATRAAIRAQFSTLSGSCAFLENAGGSQVPAVVANALRDYMLSSYVQLGAGYPLSLRADAVVARAHDFVSLLMGGEDQGTVILGASASQLCAMLAASYAERLEPGDEIVVVETGHEANVGPWMRLSSHGLKVRTWRVDPARLACPLDDLEALLNERTRLVAALHVSNLLGEIVDVAELARRVHAVGARLVVDGVAYAPHRAMAVAEWDVDWYVYSTYKVYGPHMGALYGKPEALAELSGPNHFFIPESEIPYKFELGGVSHEACAGLLALGGYLRFLAAGARAVPDPDSSITRPEIERAFDLMTRCELPLQRRLIDYLSTESRYRLVGPEHGGRSRVGTISFLHVNKSSAQICAALQARDIAVRNGHMYAYRLCRALGLDPSDGVVRVSLLHYNDMEEIERVISVLAAEA